MKLSNAFAGLRGLCEKLFSGSVIRPPRLLLSGVVAPLMSRLGKSYRIDPAVPTALLMGELSRRLWQLFRGLLRTRRICFIGSGVKLRGKRYLRLGRAVTIVDYAVIDAFGRDGVVLGDRVKIGRGTVITTTSHLSKFGVGLAIGADSGIGDYCHIGCSGGVTIGRDVIVGPYASFHSQEHNFRGVDVPIRSQGTTESGIVIESNVWIGAKATILDGTTIGRGSVVAAGAVVKGAFRPGSVIAGVPARIVATVNAVEPIPNGAER